jgi:hypothetical protein
LEKEREVVAPPKLDAPPKPTRAPPAGPKPAKTAEETWSPVVSRVDAAVDQQSPKKNAGEKNLKEQLQLQQQLQEEHHHQQQERLKQAPTSPVVKKEGLAPVLPPKPRTSSFSVPKKSPLAVDYVKENTLQREVWNCLPFLSLIDQQQHQQQKEKESVVETEKKGTLQGLKKMGKSEALFRESEVMNDQLFLWNEQTNMVGALRCSLGGLVNVASVCAGKTHFLLLLDSGKVFSWGSVKTNFFFEIRFYFFC